MKNIKETMENKQESLYNTSIKFVERCIKSTEESIHNKNNPKFMKTFFIDQLKKHYDQKCKILEERVNKDLPLEDPPEILDIITPKSYMIKDGKKIPVPSRLEE
jgi:hypothetical protein